MAAFQGIEDFVAAVTGGSGYEQAGYNAAQERLSKQRYEQAKLDKALEQAALAKDINVNRGNALGAIDNPVLRGITGGSPGMGANYSGAQTGIQTGIENENMVMARKALAGAIERGEPVPADILNAVNAINGKMMGPTNVQVQEQATAALGKNNEGINAAKALTETRQARTAEINEPDPPGSEKAISIETPSAGERDLLLEMTKPEQVIKAENNWFSPDIKGETIDAEYKDLYPEFLQFQMQHIATDPNMKDSAYALAKFLESRKAGASGVPVAGASAAPASPTATLRYVVGPDGNLVLAQ